MSHDEEARGVDVGRGDLELFRDLGCERRAATEMIHRLSPSLTVSQRGSRRRESYEEHPRGSEVGELPTTRRLNRPDNPPRPVPRGQPVRVHVTALRRRECGGRGGGEIRERESIVW